MSNKNLVVIGLLGAEKDSGKSASRWDKWRPTVDLCRHGRRLPVKSLELLYQPKHKSILNVVAADIASVSPRTEVRPREIGMSDPWDFEEVYGALYDFIRTYKFNREEEEYLVHTTTGSHVAQVSLFLLTESNHLPGKLLRTIPPGGSDKSKAGSFNIIDLDLSTYERIRSRLKEQRGEGVSFLKDGIETKNARFNQTMDMIERVAITSTEPLLLTGPTGSGKSKLARRIYDLKVQRNKLNGEFAEVNCATIRGGIAQSTLFGHVRGAFTGASNVRKGLLRKAHQGVLFLDEIGDLGAEEQTMLLRALEEKRFSAMGSDDTVESDFQLIAGTNRDLEALVEKGSFRDDLLARIDLWTFPLPGLRDRLEDIEPNIGYELDRYAKRTGRRVIFKRDAHERFLRFATTAEAKWTRNFRDLNGAIIRMATLADTGRIEIRLVEEEITRLRAIWQIEASGGESYRLLKLLIGKERLSKIDYFDRIQLEGVLKVCRESRNLSEAGRILYNASRDRKNSDNDSDRLGKYLAKFGLKLSQIHEVAQKMQ